MGFKCRFVASLLALSGAASAIKPHMARATPVNQRYHEHGWTPKPTTRPKSLQELFRRQVDPEFCGYLEGDRGEPIACDPGSSCMYNEALSWFGCCTGSAITDCDVYTECVRSSNVDDCLSDSSCRNNPLVMGCTRRSMPYCAVLYTVVSDQSFGHFVCDSTSTSYEVVSAATTGDDVESSFSPLATTSDDDDSTTSRRPRPTQPELTNVTTPPPRSRPTQPALFSSGSDSDTSSVPVQTPAGTPTSGGPAVAPPTQTQSNAAALRTAEAVAGAIGGVAGLFAFLL